MSTDSVQHLGVMSRVGEQLRRLICGLHGHDSLLHFSDGRVSLLCSSCGHETPGWDVKAAHGQDASVKAGRREAARPQARVVRMPLVSERRVA